MVILNPNKLNVEPVVAIDHRVPDPRRPVVFRPSNDADVDRKSLPPSSSQPPLPLDARMREGQHIRIAVVEETF